MEYPDLLRGGYMVHMDTNIQGPKDVVSDNK